MRIKRMLIGVVLFLTVCSVGALPAAAQERGGKAQATPSGCPAVPQPVPIPDVPYAGTDPRTDPRHTLDIYPAPTGTVAPIVITVHGGGWVRGDNSGKRITCITQRLHELGYAVFSINYRQATPQQDGVPMQTNDITLATRWVKANGGNYGGDTNNITLLGGSSGAQLVALAGLLMNQKQPGLLRGVIEMSGVMDFPSFFNQPGQPPPGDEQHQGASTYLGCVPSQCTEAQLKAASPAWRIRGTTCPDFLLINGEDELLPATQATNMHQKLRAAGCTSTLRLVPNTMQHGLALFPFTEQLIVQFLNSP